MNELKVGISAVTAYVPPYRVDLEKWCDWSEKSWEKINHVIGSGFRILGPNQSIYTMAANAVLGLIESYKIDPSKIGFLALGTESSTDNSAGSVIIKGMVNNELKDRKLNPIAKNCEVPEFKQACLSGIYAVKNAVRFLKSDAPESKAIVVCSDNALYPIGTRGEPTQGAGAVAILIEVNPKIAEVHTNLSGSASDYRLIDFRKPIHYRAKNGNEASDFNLDLPIFNSKYSSTCYIDQTINALADMSKKRGLKTIDYLREIPVIFMHRPFQKMPITAFTIVYLHALSDGNRDDLNELSNYAKSADVVFDDLLNELKTRPNISDYPLNNNIQHEPLPLTQVVSKICQKNKNFQAKVLNKLNFGDSLTREMGNIYSGSVFGWFAAGLDDAIDQEVDWTNQEGLLFGYGSGDAAEVIPIRFVENWKEAVFKAKFSNVFLDSYDLSKEEYSSLRTQKKPNGIDHKLKNQFIVEKIGTEERDDFQDAGIEYYQYLS